MMKGRGRGLGQGHSTKLVKGLTSPPLHQELYEAELHRCEKLSSKLSKAKEETLESRTQLRHVRLPPLPPLLPCPYGPSPLWDSLCVCDSAPPIRGNSLRRSKEGGLCVVLELHTFSLTS